MLGYATFGVDESGRNYIERKDYSVGAFAQSSRIEKDGITYSNGTVVRVGRHDFGPVKGYEEIKITFGEITINGKRYKEGETAILYNDDANVWEVAGPATYLCKFKERR